MEIGDVQTRPCSPAVIIVILLFLLLFLLRLFVC